VVILTQLKKNCLVGELLTGY